jgi:dTDP-4-dehydrorhamnose reductase
MAVAIWGGIEQTLRRKHNHFDDQLVRNGHHQRLSDLDAIAALGIKTLRYPLLWERIAPEGIHKADWRWTDERLTKLRELGITPIAGLLHHGSGPAYTNLIDPDFAPKFCEFAVAVAERYPWLEWFTPINEPLTTARFSCLYGHWYPHLQDDHHFALALLNQTKATIIAMAEIKKILPAAKLVQTEDLGKCHATKHMQYQADFENQRRWLSLDLLCGKLGDNKTMLEYLRSLANIHEKQLQFFIDNSCPPDIVGINYYITSERFLDEKRDQYPAWSYANNGRDKYADLDILRVDIHKREGHYRILKSAAERYGLPIALTEVHLGSSRDAQLRWFKEAYNSVNQLHSEGIDVRGITVWSILGSYDWNTLITQANNYYEPGVFDVRSGQLRPTANAQLIKKMCAGDLCHHPVLQAEGWWKNPEHVHFEFGTKPNARGLPSLEKMFPENLVSSRNRPVLIIGARGTLGRAFAHICGMRNISYVLLSRKDMDIGDPSMIDYFFKRHFPWAVINAAGFVRVDDAESERDTCLRENTTGAELLAQACASYKIPLLTFSSDLVFDGDKGSPYVESDTPNPLNHYGFSKMHAEQKVLSAHSGALVVRTSAFFGPWDDYNFLAQLLNCVRSGEVFLAAKDQVISPTYIPDLVSNCLDLLIDEASGIWHLANPSALSWAEFASLALKKAGLNSQLVKPVPASALSQKAKRPDYSPLRSERGIVLPSLEDALTRFMRERN